MCRVQYHYRVDTVGCHPSNTTKRERARRSLSLTPKTVFVVKSRLREHAVLRRQRGLERMSVFHNVVRGAQDGASPGSNKL